MLRTLGGYVLAATALVACPCHLPLTVPLLLALLGGTSLGVLLGANLSLVFVAAAAYFLVALFGAVWLLGRRSAAATGRIGPNTPVLASECPRGLPADRLRATPTIEPAGGRLRVQILKTPGCVSCAAVERSWEALRPQYSGRVQVEVADLLDQPELARRYGVLRTPAVVIGDRLRAQGALDATRLGLLLDEALREHGAVARAAEGAHA